MIAAPPDSSLPGTHRCFYFFQVASWEAILSCLDQDTGLLLTPGAHYLLPTVPVEASADALPKHVYTFWHKTSSEPMSEILAACLASIKKKVAHAGWTLHVLDLNSPEVQLPSTVYPWKDKTDARWVAHLTDWIRLDVLARLGGVWLDASTVLLDGPDKVFDTESSKLQGFELATYNPPGTMENWALASPPQNKLLTRWRDIFTDAVSQGDRP